MDQTKCKDTEHSYAVLTSQVIKTGISGIYISGVIFCQKCGDQIVIDTKPAPVKPDDEGGHSA